MKKCLNCHKKIDKRSKRCSSCHIKYLWKLNKIPRKQGKEHHFYGKHHTQKTKKLLSILRKGKQEGNKNPMYGKKRPDLSIWNKINNKYKNQWNKNNPNWNNGSSFFPYSSKFTKQIKEQIRKRDKYICQLCNKQQNKHYRKLDVHHIDYNKQNCKKNNLISLCNSCNIKVNSNRDYWFAYFTYIVEKI